jgi:hypothetical protein
MPSRKMDRYNFIKEEGLKLVTNYQPGRQPKAKAGTSSKASKKGGKK